MEILDILTRESENTQQVYLYEEEGHWYAYERSAQLIKQLFKGLVKIKQFVNTTYDIILDRVEIDLGTLIEKCPITLCSDSEMMIEYPRMFCQQPVYFISNAYFLQLLPGRKYRACDAYLHIASIFYRLNNQR